ncbi:CLUMA_CG003790, isoform A [Clunio marinus]|uniref:CLUMA_CG003790, isoform A n=1 Tax=Clunio marinus TaxID=568069 RepID=A0A1J1HPU4_9DIPT|nr:CLUMA_CG003790, isoform A [Clunio marinus]
MKPQETDLESETKEDAVITITNGTTLPDDILRLRKRRSPTIYHHQPHNQLREKKEVIKVESRDIH